MAALAYQWSHFVQISRSNVMRQDFVSQVHVRQAKRNAAVMRRENVWELGLIV